MRSRWQEFLDAAALETDDCVPFPPGRLTNPGVSRKVQLAHEALAMRTAPPPGALMGRFSTHAAAHGPCHNPHCINYRHLSWKTRSENALDMHRDGTMLVGADNPMFRQRPQSAKLTAEQATEIQLLYATGEATQRALAAEYGVSQRTVNNAIHSRYRTYSSRYTVEIEGVDQ